MMDEYFILFTEILNPISYGFMYSSLFPGVKNRNTGPFCLLADLIWGRYLQRSGKQTCSNKSDPSDRTE